MTRNPLENINIAATLMNTNLETTWSKNTAVKVAADAVTETGIVVPETEEMQFLKLVATDAQGNMLSENLYWISKSNNYKALNSLPDPKLDISAALVSKTGKHTYRVTARNTGKTLAFMLTFRVTGKDSKQEILPCYWSDNYISLLPGETRTLEVAVPTDAIMEDIMLEYNTFGSAANAIRVTSNAALK